MGPVVETTTGAIRLYIRYFAGEVDDDAAVVPISFGVRLVLYLLPPTNNDNIKRRELLLLFPVTTIFKSMLSRQRRVLKNSKQVV